MATLPALRRSRFLTQTALAKQLGIGNQSISLWEAGITKPSMENLKKLCEFFGVEPNDIEFPLKGLGVTAEMTHA